MVARKKKKVDASCIPDHFKSVFDFIPPCDLDACFRVCKGWNAEVFHRCPQLREVGKLNSYQKNTLNRLKGFRIKNIVAAVDRVCVLCEKGWRGGFHEAFGIPAHPACVKDCLVNSSYLRLGESKSFVMGNIPHHSLPGYSRRTGTFKYDVVWRYVHPAVPRVWTVEGFCQYMADNWDSLFEKLARESSSPFGSSEELDRALPEGVWDVIRDADAEVTVRRGNFAVLAKGVIDELCAWRWIYEKGADEAGREVAALRVYPDVSPLLRPLAFRRGVKSPEAFAGTVSDAFASAVQAVLGGKVSRDPSDVYHVLKKHPGLVEDHSEIIRLIPFWNLEEELARASTLATYEEVRDSLLRGREVKIGSDGRMRCLCGNTPSPACSNDACKRCCTGCTKHRR